jgi:hypothetical protein
VDPRCTPTPSALTPTAHHPDLTCAIEGAIEVDDREAVANLSHARLFDTKRLIRKSGTVDEPTFRELAKPLALRKQQSLWLSRDDPVCVEYGNDTGRFQLAIK